MATRSNATLLLLLVLGSHSLAQEEFLISSFEDGLEGWVESGFNDKPTFLEGLDFGATDGEFSLAILQEGDGFSWNAKLDVPRNSPTYDAFKVAAAAPEDWGIAYDVTFDTDSIPQAGTTFVGVSFWINSDDTFRDVFNRPISSGAEDVVISEVVRFVDPELGSISTAEDTFYQIGFALNGNWGNGDAVVYIDNIRLTQDFASVPGDVNNDSLADIIDVELLCSGLASQSMAAELDVDGNGTVDGDDLTALHELAGTLPGDVDGNGTVDFADFLVQSSHFGQAGQAFWWTGDFNCDGTLGFPDFLLLSANFGKSANAAAVPEPDLGILILTGLLSGPALRGRRRRTLDGSFISRHA